jgi:hypothetical protein
MPELSEATSSSRHEYFRAIMEAGRRHRPRAAVARAFFGIWVANTSARQISFVAR